MNFYPGAFVLLQFLLLAFFTVCTSSTSMFPFFPQLFHHYLASDWWRLKMPLSSLPLCHEMTFRFCCSSMSSIAKVREPIYMQTVSFFFRHCTYTQPVHNLRRKLFIPFKQNGAEKTSVPWCNITITRSHHMFSEERFLIVLNSHSYLTELSVIQLVTNWCYCQGFVIIKLLFKYMMVYIILWSYHQLLGAYN